jgi:hypothetical protein
VDVPANAEPSSGAMICSRIASHLSLRPVPLAGTVVVRDGDDVAPVAIYLHRTVPA